MYKRYFLRIAYDGTNYHGWQNQPNGITVQEVIEKWLAKILHVPRVVTTGCGRTDAGVHAKDFYLHFNPEVEELDIEQTMFRLGHVLPKDIAAYDLFPVHENAHTRFDAVERSYEYHMHYVRSPFYKDFSTYCNYRLDIDKMNEAAKYLIKHGDFASFSRTGGGQKTSICDVRAAYWEQNGERLIFHITADRFLRNMVRAVVGTLMDVGRNKITIEQFGEIVELADRNKAGDSARPEGLHLSKIVYPYIDENGYDIEKAVKSTTFSNFDRSGKNTIEEEKEE
jgi:tRNA pseudouridine38-40 synthase